MALTKLGSVKAVTQVLVTSANLASEVTGVLPVANGGTGQSTFTNGQLLIGNTTGNTLAKATLTGTSNQLVVTNGAGTITLSTPQDIHTGATPQFTRLGLGAAASSTHNLLIAGGTITADAHLLDLAVTWNNAAVTFTGIKSNVTDTASVSLSLLMDLQVGGSSMFSVSKSGTVSTVALNATSFASVGGVAVLTESSTNTITNKTIAGNTNFITGVEGFIQGCKLEYLTTTSIRVTPGMAYIQSTGKILKLSANDDTSPSLSASTWYHVYLYDNSGTTDTEVSTTAPAASWIGTAKSKTGDTTRRYLGSFRTNSSSEILNFMFTGSGSEFLVLWRNVVSNTMRAVSAGTATTNAGGVFSVANMCPSGVRNVYARFFSNANQGLRTDADDMTGTDPDSNIGYVAISAAGGDIYCPHSINSSQEMRYAFAATVTNGGGFYCDIYGYFLER